MESNFASGANAVSAVGLVHDAFISLGDSAKDNILAGYLHIVTQCNAVGHREVYEAGVFTACLEPETGPDHPM